MSANPKITAIHNKLVSDYIAVTRAEHAAWLDERKAAMERMEERRRQALKYILKNKEKWLWERQSVEPYIVAGAASL